MERRDFIKKTIVSVTGIAGSVLGVDALAKSLSSDSEDIISTKPTKKTENMKIVVLTGSPRRNGNTSFLADQFINGATESGHDVFRFDCASHKIEGCLGCNACGMKGRALLPHAEDIYRGILNARTALKGFGTHHTLTLRLPPVLLQRDPIYPILMARLHAALPGYEFKVDTTPVPSSYHHMLCTEADAALYLPFGPLPPEIRCETIIGNRFYLITAPEHPFSGQSSVELSALAGQQIFYEPLYQDMVDFAQKQPGMPYSTPVWRMVENYESVYAELLAGRGMFLCPMIYPAFPAGWHIPLHLSIPDTRLLTLRDDPRPEICTLRKVFAEVYAEREKLIKAL